MDATPDTSIEAAIAARDFEAIERAGSTAVYPLLVALRDPEADYNVRRWAFHALRRLEERAVPRLILALKDRDAFIRRDAARALEIAKDTRAVEPLVQAATQDRDILVRLRAVQALQQIPDERTISSLIALLGDDDRQIRRNATNALINVGRDAIEPLVAALGNRSRSDTARWHAAHALGFIRDEHALQPLISILHDATQPTFVRTGAAIGLQLLGSGHVVSPLIATLSDPNGDVRASAAHALGEYARFSKEEPDTMAVESLMHVLVTDESPRARWMAAQALQFYADERTLPLLLTLRHAPAMSKEERRIQNAAGFAVKYIRYKIGRHAAQ